MPYKTSEAQAEAQRRYRERITQRDNATVNPAVNPEPEIAQEATRDNVNPLVPGFDGKMKAYDPGTDGVDGWHETDKGMKYILQDTGMGGMGRCYRPGSRMFSYR